MCFKKKCGIFSNPQLTLIHTLLSDHLYNVGLFKVSRIMSNTFRFGDISPFRYFFIIALILGLVFGLIQHDDDSKTTLVFTVFQWIIQTSIPIIFLVVVHLSLQNWQRFNRLNPWFKLTLSGLIGAVLFTPFAFALDTLLLGEHWPQNQYALLLQLADEASGVIPPIVIVWITINAPWVMQLEFRKMDVSTSAQTTTSIQPSVEATPAFLQLMRTPTNAQEILYA